jgi:phenylpropionate dioxygenase-like ring-hydroxylating dioxygenase large terminal subunit
VTDPRLRSAPRDGRTRHLNRQTQPLHEHPVFHNPAVVAEGWYPLFASADLPRSAVRPAMVATQRLAVWRDEAGEAHAVDAFCAHMGADLSNGRVRDGALECYFHQWRFGPDGALVGVRCGDRPDRVQLAAWPTAEAYGWVWAWAGARPTHAVPAPPGLEGRDLVHRHVATVRLLSHHHAMMAGGIDVQHFASVHGLSADLDVRIDEQPHTADWHVRGPIPAAGWRARAARALLGDTFSYVARFAGASIVTLTYGPDARLGGAGRPLPALHVLWGCVPLASGVSDVHVWLVAPRDDGRLRAQARLALTAGLLAGLTDDDARAFPWMRFHTGRLVALDDSVARLARFLNRQPISPWGGAPPGWGYADP